MLVEIGGTVGDIESLPFLEAIRQFRQDVGRDNTLYIHLTLVPFIGAAGELKTKPTQHSVRDLRVDRHPARHPALPHRPLPRRGHQAEDRAVLRRRRGSGDHRQGRRRRIYEVPLVLAAEGLDRIVLKHLHLPQTEARMDAWEELVDRIKNPTDEITIHVVGKYVGYEDSYKSLNEALYHGGFAHGVEGATSSGSRPRRSSEPSGDAAARRRRRHPRARRLRQSRHARHDAAPREIARERGIPYFGICYGFQWATVEYARNVCGLDRRRLDRVRRPTRRTR